MAGKSVLVIDTPKTCKECPINSHTEYDFDVCWITQGKGGCPLRPLPQKMTMEKALKMERVGAIKDIYTTWNACLDEITGETE